MTSRHLLAPGEVQVWYTFYDSQVDHPADERRLAVLSAEERERRARFRFARHQRQYLVAHALVRCVLSRYSNAPPEAWRFVANSYGRPEIAEPLDASPGLRFNLSHTEGLVVCGVTHDDDLGVDVENLGRRAVSEGLPERYFSPAEVADLRRLPREEQGRVFFDYWTLKEAYIKARGMGLAIPLDKFSYRLSQGTVLGIGFADDWQDDPDHWQFAQHRPGPDHLISVALRRRRDRPARIEFHASEADPGRA